MQECGIVHLSSLLYYRLFVYFLACHPYISFGFLMIFLFYDLTVRPSLGLLARAVAHVAAAAVLDVALFFDREP